MTIDADSNCAVNYSVNGNTGQYVTMGQVYPLRSGDVIKLQVITPDGYIFHSWSDGDMRAIRTMSLTDSVHITAHLIIAPTMMEGDDFILPLNTTTVGEQALQGIKAKVIRIPDDVTYIGSQAFAGNPYPQQIVFDATNIAFADDALAGLDPKMVVMFAP